MRQLSHDENKALMEEIVAVVNKYIPEYSKLLDKWQNDNDDDDDDDTKPDYDSESPKYVDGIVLLVSVSNLEGFSRLFLHAPSAQNRYLTSGMIFEASPYNY